jgi:hypothetical protein
MWIDRISILAPPGSVGMGVMIGVEVAVGVTGVSVGEGVGDEGRGEGEGVGVGGTGDGVGVRVAGDSGALQAVASAVSTTRTAAAFARRAEGAWDESRG